MKLNPYIEVTNVSEALNYLSHSVGLDILELVLIITDRQNANEEKLNIRYGESSLTTSNLVAVNQLINKKVQINEI